MSSTAHGNSSTTRRRILALPLICATTLLIGVVGPPTASAAPEAAVPMSTTTNFGVLAGTSVTSTGPTTVDGNLGLSPGTSVTGFSPGQVNGTVNVNDVFATQAIADLSAAYDAGMALPIAATIPEELGGLTVPPGVYDSSSGVFTINGTLILDAEGDPNAKFVFKAPSTLITGDASEVIMINDARTANTLWTVGDSATLGADSTMVGNLLAATSINVMTGAAVHGRILARDGEVTLDSNTITRPVDVPQAIASTTTHGLTSSVNPSVGGEPVTFTVTVTQDFDPDVPTGLVSFRAKRTVLGTALLDANGVATLTTSALGVSRHSITAAYHAADGFLASSTSTPYMQLVQPAA